MTKPKIAFCFPGQGSFEVGMGRDIAEAVPEAMDVFRRGSDACGLDLARLCFEGEAEELYDTAGQQPAPLAASPPLLPSLPARGVQPGGRGGPPLRPVSAPPSAPTPPA